MDIQAVKTFLRVVRMGGFTAAAREMSYAQSTVTMQIKSLERELGYPLFERAGRGCRLTPEGSAFLPCAEQIADAVEAAKTVGADARALRGCLRIGVLESLLLSRVLPLLPRLCEAFPLVELDIKIGQTTELLSRLRQGVLDLAFVSCESVSDGALRTLYEKTESLVFVASAAHPLAKAPRVSHERLFSYPFAVTEHSGYCYGELKRIAARGGFALRQSVTVDSIEAIRSLLSDGNTLAFLPEMSVAGAAGLCALPVEGEPSRYQSQLLCLKGKRLSPVVTALLGLLETE
ncbi:MAG: LysR family transcriptional regulator [Clostridia bacterium]|nr:LysR family transcriptional regulator [Clostridia bacterium]